MNVRAAALEFGDPTAPVGAASATTTGDNSADLAAGSSTAPKVPRWTLSSTLLSPNRRVAVINGYSVQAGDKVDGAHVVSVDSRQAVIRVSGRNITLKMPAASGDRLTAKKPSGR